MQQLSLIQTIAIWAIPVLFAITVHEAAHGWVASKLGDPTAKMLGRITLNPFKHIDIVGTIIVPLALLWLGGFIFGWAKPVPIGWRNLRNPRRDVALVAAAGPASNFLMAIFWGAIMRLGMTFSSGSMDIWTAIHYMGKAGILINVVLLVLNLLPIPPLDGSRVVASFLTPKASYYYSRIEPYGFFILIGLLATGLLGTILGAPVMFLYSLLNFVFSP